MYCIACNTLLIPLFFSFSKIKWNLFVQLYKKKNRPASKSTRRDPVPFKMAFAAKGSPEALTSVTYNGSAVRAIWKFEILSVCGKCLVPSPQWHFNFVKLSFVYKMLLVQEAQPRLGIMKHFVSFTQTVIYFWRSLPILFSIWQSKIVDLVERWLVRGSHSISF